MNKLEFRFGKEISTGIFEYYLYSNDVSTAYAVVIDCTITLLRVKVMDYFAVVHEFTSNGVILALQDSLEYLEAHFFV